MSEDSLFCLFCAKNLVSTEIIKSNEELLCANCGFVLKEEHTYTDVPESTLLNKANSNTIHSWKEDLPTTSYELGLSTSIDKNCKDHTGKSFLTKSNLNLKKTSLRAKSTTSVERNSFKGYMEAVRLGKALDIPSHVIKKVIDTYYAYSKQGVLKNRNVNSCIVCLLVIFCNHYDVPLPINEALKETTVSRKKFNKDYFNLYYMFEKATPSSANVSAYLEKLESNISSSWQYLKQFKKIMEEIKEKGVFQNIEGRDAIVTTGSTTYVILKHLRYPFLDSFARSLVLNRLTIKNKWLSLIQRWPFLNKYNLPLQE